MISIQPAQKQDIPALADLFADAFQGAPFYNFCFPDPAGQEAFLRKFMLFRVRYGLKAGRGFQTADGAGAAVWIPPGRTMKPADLLLCGGLSAMLAAGKPAAKQLMALNDFADQVERDACPGRHWHLSPLGVRPGAQGQGVGSALLAHGLAQIDARGESCCLDTQNPEAVGLYERFGFRIQRDTVVPGTGIRHVAMLRPPRKPAQE